MLGERDANLGRRARSCRSWITSGPTTSMPNGPTRGSKWRRFEVAMASHRAQGHRALFGKFIELSETDSVVTR